MQIQKTYSFYSQDLNKIKYDLLMVKATAIRNLKNEVSFSICNNASKFMSMSKFDWITHFRTKLEHCNNQDVSHAISDVFVAYENKRAQFTKNLSVKIQKNVLTNRYQKTGKNFYKSEFKSFIVNMKSTNLTTTVTYLSRYMNDELIDFLGNSKSTDLKIQEFRDMVLAYVNKYGERIISLAKSKQQRVVGKTFQHPIEFKSLSFTSCTEVKQNIISKSKSDSKTNAYITISGQKTPGGKIHIPVNQSDKHHGPIKHYFKKFNKKNTRNTTYIVIFHKKGQVRICLTRLKEDVFVTDKTKYYGVDVNVKHNLFCDKNGLVIDYDRELFNDYVKFLKKIDNKLSQKPIGERKLSNRDQIAKYKWRVRVKDMLKRKSSELVKQAKQKGNDHIVMEDLQNMGKSFSRSDEMEGFKYSRLIRLLNLSDLKNIVSSIGNKNGVQTTFIQPHYTSKSCKCGCIDDRNRTTQEIFKCISCSHEESADAHAASMIEDRLTSDVLRESLLDFKNGIYTTKKLNKDLIKNMLVNCYYNNSTCGNKYRNLTHFV